MNSQLTNNWWINAKHTQKKSGYYTGSCSSHSGIQNLYTIKKLSEIMKKNGVMKVSIF